MIHGTLNLSAFLTFCSSSANATPEFEGKGGEDLATEISNFLSSSYDSSQAFDLRSLSILEGVQCWKLYVDILVSDCFATHFLFVYIDFVTYLFLIQFALLILNSGSRMWRQPVRCSFVSCESCPLQHYGSKS